MEHGLTRRAGARRPPVLLLEPALCLGLLAGAVACGGGTSTVTVTAGAPSASTTATPTATATPGGTAGGTSSTASASTGPGGPVVTLVWTVTDAAGVVFIRTATPGGGPTRAVAALPAGSQVLAFGHGRVVAWRPDHHIVTVELATGASTAHPAGSGTTFGAAFDESGQHLAFVDAVDPGNVHLEELDLATDHLTTVAGLGNQFVVPRVWTGTTLAGPVVVGFADASQQGVRTTDAGTGATLATTTVPNAAAYTVFAGGSRGTATSHSALGDDADAVGGPGPQGPFNTLSTFGVGSGAATTVYSAAHHNVAVLAGTPDGSTMLVSDTSAAGGFAGISLSAEFGLFLAHGSSRTQVAHVGGDRQAGALFQDGTTAAVAEKAGSVMSLVQYGATGSPVTLDSVSGGQQAEVALVPGA